MANQGRPSSRTARFISSCSQNPLRAAALSLIACILVATALTALSFRSIPPTPARDLSQAPLRFERDRAHRWMKTLSKTFPGRTAWSDPRRKAAEWLSAELNLLGYEPKEQIFSETIGDRKVTDLKNVFAEKRGSELPDEAIVVAAHYDIAETTWEGAMDDASGVGIVLELARVFANETPRRSIIFLLTDSEEYGTFWGARAFAENPPRKIVAALTLDFLAPQRQTGILMLCDGLRTGFTPPWLRELSRAALQSVAQPGDRVEEVSGTIELLQRALLMPAADHGAFLAAGVPALNWVGTHDDFEGVMENYHHTALDVAEALEPRSFELPGKGAERLIRSLDMAGALPAGLVHSDEWKISPTLALPGFTAFLLHALLFVPALVFVSVRFSRATREAGSARLTAVWHREAAQLAGIALAVALAYVALRLLPTLGWVSRYEEFPGTQKSPFLYVPKPLTLLPLLASACLGYLAGWRLLRRRANSAGPSDAELGICIQLSALVLLIGVALIVNSYAAAVLLLPAAYTWIFVHPSAKRAGRKALYAALLLAGPLAFVAVNAWLSTIFHLGVTWWFLLLAASYGLLTAEGVILFLLTLGVGVRIAVLAFRRDPASQILA